MTTFGLRDADSFDSANLEYPSSSDASKQMPGVTVVPANDDHFLSSGSSDSDLASSKSTKSLREQTNEIIARAKLAAQDDDDDDDDEFPLILTQLQSQSQRKTYEPENHLVACLMPSSNKFERFELHKYKTKWRIGRHPTNDLVLTSLKLSNFHCTLEWNGKKGKQSEVVIMDMSTNGTWVNNKFLGKGSSSILKCGEAVSLGSQPDMPSDWRFIYQDVEGRSEEVLMQIWAKYDVGYELGLGAFARVHECHERLTGEKYAVKIIDRSKLKKSQAGEASLVREISILKQLAEFRHKNIVSMREYYEEPDSIYLILEYVRGGDLLTYIGRNGALSEQEVRRMAAQICHAVAYIHSQGIAHRDLKPENILVTEGPSPDCKVADFGLAKLVEGGTFLKTLCGTPGYLAPEVVLRSDTRQAYDNRVDSWSLGVIFYCMLTNHSPFPDAYDPDASPAEQQKYFGERRTDWRTLYHFNISEDGHDFLRHLLAEDPRNRTSVTRMLDHRWISALVPSDSQFQHPLPSVPSVQTSSSVQTTSSTDDGDRCSQSLRALSLNPSQMAIPGLSLPAPSVDVTASIPGAFPPSLQADASWEVVATPAKRKNNPLESSSPLSSLSDSESESTTPEPEPVRKRTAVRKRAPPAPPRRKKKTASPEVQQPPRRSGRATRPPPLKTPRYV